MRILFVIRNTNYLHLYRSIVAELMRRGHSVYCLYDKKWTKDIVPLPEYGSSSPEHAYYERAIQRMDWKRIILFYARELRAYYRVLNEPKQSKRYEKLYHSFIPRSIQSLFRVPACRKLLLLLVKDSFFRSIERVISPDKKIMRQLRNRKPDVCITAPTTMRFSSADMEYLKAAVKLNIPTVIPVLSWDNLNTKNIVPVVPTKMLVWNETQKKEAMTYHHIPEDRIEITGAFSADKWFLKQRPTHTRDAFMQVCGLDPSKSMMAYLGSGNDDEHTLDESKVVRKLHAALRTSPYPECRTMQMIVRPHPANADVYNDVNLDGVIVFPKKDHHPTSDETFNIYYDTLYYAEATFGINTSAMIEALIAGKTVISTCPQGFREYQKTIHFDTLFEQNALVWVERVEDIPRAIYERMKGGDTKEKERIQFAKNCIRPNGIPASVNAANIIESLVIENK